MTKARVKKGRPTKRRREKVNPIVNVLRDWAEASGKNESDFLGLDNAPEWVLNAWVECCKIVFPGGLPLDNKWDAESVGILFGRLWGLKNLYAGQVPLGLETQGELAKLEAAARGKPPLANAAAIETDFLTKFKATDEAIPLAASAATSASYKDALSFQKGLARGMEIGPEELATSRTFERHTRTYFVLGLFWRFWSTRRSLTEVYEILCKAVGETRVGSFKTFEKVCRKIGFSVRGRGRPRKSK